MYQIRCCFFPRPGSSYRRMPTWAFYLRPFLIIDYTGIQLHGSVIYNLIAQISQSCRCSSWDHGSSLAFENITQSLWPALMQHLAWLQLPSRSAYTFQLTSMCNADNSSCLILHSSDSTVFVFHLRIYSVFRRDIKFVFHQRSPPEFAQYLCDVLLWYCYSEVDLKRDQLASILLRALPGSKCPLRILIQTWTDTLLQLTTHPLVGVSYKSSCKMYMK